MKSLILGTANFDGTYGISSQNKIANAIAEAIISYKKEYFGNGDGYAEEDRPSKKIVEKPTTDTANPPKKEAVKEEVEVKKDNKKDKQKELDNASGIQFKIQIGASKKKIDLVTQNALKEQLKSQILKQVSFV